jgi:RimJ/RimL family protein N-acetyltransferase
MTTADASDARKGSLVLNVARYEASDATELTLMARVGTPAGRLTGSYGRWVIDLDWGWSTERLDLEPLAVAHAAELAPLLDDPALHEFTGGAPLSAAALAARYARLAARRSPEGDQTWGNWVVRVRATGTAAGTVQATLPAGGPAAGPAEVAWVVIRPAQGRGYATEAARSLVALLHEAGWTVVAHIHPSHLASQQVARGAGLSPTADVRDGEIRWVSPPPAAPLPQAPAPIPPFASGCRISRTSSSMSDRGISRLVASRRSRGATRSRSFHGPCGVGSVTCRRAAFAHGM